MKKFFTLFLMIIFLFSFVFSDDSSDSSIDYEINRITSRNELDRELKYLRSRQLEIEKEIKRRETQEILDSNPPKDDGEEKIFVKQIFISGNKKISTKKLRKIIRNFENKYLKKSDLQKLQNDIMNLYIKKGYIFVTPLLDIHEIDDFILKIKIIEGEIDNIEFSEIYKSEKKTKNKKLELFFAFPSLKNKIINIRKIEQGLENLNKLKSNNATMNLIPSEKEGFSTLSIENNLYKKYELSLNINNQGTETNRYKENLSLNLDNIFHVNDNLSLDYSRGYKDNQDFYNRNYNINLNFPFRYLDINFSFYNSSYLITKQGIKSSGETKDIKFLIKRILFRNKISKNTFGFSVEKKDNSNFINEEKLDYSSRILAPFEIFLENTTYIKKGYIFFRFNYTKGLDEFNAKKDEDNSIEPKAQYRKLGFYGNFNKNIYKFNYSLSLRGQYSYDNLFGSEQFSPSIRSYKDGCSSSDSGYQITNELKMNLLEIFPFIKGKVINFFLQGVQIGFFYDDGKIFPKTVDEIEEYSGYGYLLNIYRKYLSVNTSLGNTIKTGNIDKKEKNTFSLSVNFSINF